MKTRFIVWAVVLFVLFAFGFIWLINHAFVVMTFATIFKIAGAFIISTVIEFVSVIEKDYDTS